MGLWQLLFGRNRKVQAKKGVSDISNDTDSKVFQRLAEKEQKIRRYIAERVYQSTNSVADGMNEIATNIDLLSEQQKSSFGNISKIKDDIDATDLSIKKSGDLISSLKKSTKDLSTLKPQIENQSVHLRELETKIENIYEIDTHVKLLSFNASLEASRAGDAGRSFMVVADEIQKLSSVTNKHLGEMSKALSAYLEKNSLMSSSVSSFVDNETNIVLEFSEIISDLLVNVDVMTSDLASLSANVETQLKEIENIKTKTAQKVESLNLEMSQLIDSVLETKVIDLTPQNVYENRHLYHIIDVRRDDEFNGELGHIENSSLITISPNFSNELQNLDRTKTYLFVCRSGGRSARAARIAQISGFRNVYNMTGGMLEW